MRIILCDDDHIFLELLKKYIIEYFKRKALNLPEIITYQNGEELLAQHPQNFDLLFLDIEMPGSNGILIAQKIKELFPQVLLFIVTSYAEYLDDAMNIQVYRYLSKPLDKQRLFRNLKDALRQLYLKSHKIVIETSKTVNLVYINEIVMIERLNRNVFVYTVNEVYESIHPMSYWIEKLNYPIFYQPHRSYITNFQYIDSYNKDNINLLNGTYKACIAKRKYTQFRKSHLDYMESMR